MGRKIGEDFKLSFNLTNKLFYVAAGILILVMISVGVYASLTAPNPGHTANQIFIKIGTYYVTLQNAVTKGYLAGTASPTASDSFPITSAYALASQVLITIAGQTMTLQQAFDTGALTTGVSQTGYSYTTSLFSYENASEINVSIGGQTMNLQQATDLKKLCVPKTKAVACSDLGYTCGTPSNGCGGTINCGTCGVNTECSSSSGGTCASTCVPSVGESCGSCGGIVQCGGSCSVLTPANFGASCTLSGDASCVTAGTIQCDGSCSGGYVAKGTDCNSAGTSACDASGNCLGWSGTGCSNCPFGTTELHCSSDNSNHWFCANQGNTYQGRYSWSGSWKSWSYNIKCLTNTWWEGARCGDEVCPLSQPCYNSNDIQWQMKP